MATLPLPRRVPLSAAAGFIVLTLAAGHCTRARAQAMATAAQTLNISVFAGATGTYTGIQQGRNAAITAGVDLSFLPVHRLYPTVEVRGSEPIDDGAVDAEKNLLGGLKLAGRFGRLHPYGDFFVGRGSIEYLNGGLQVPGKPIYYTLSHTTVYSPGLGLDFDLSSQWAIKLDGQYQR